MSRKRDKDDPRRYRRGSSFNQGQKDENRYVLWLRSGWPRIRVYVKNNWIIVKPCLIFAVCILVFMLLYSWFSDTAPIRAYTDHVAGATAAILQLFDENIHAFYPPGANPYVASPQIEVNYIGLECTGIIPMLILIAAVIAYPSTIKSKTMGILIGLILIYGANIIRTTILFAISANIPGFFDIAHNIIGQAIMILLAIAVWLLWVSRLTSATEK